jgi:PPOX class probable F420-dependent enzyme
MYEMSRDEWWEFAGGGTRTGKIGVTRADGSPHVTPIWFVLNSTGDTDELIFNTGMDTLKGRALRRDPRISVVVDDERPPFAFVQFTAEASLHGGEDELDETLEWATRIGARYMGPERGEEFGKRNAVPDEYLVRAKITKVVAVGGIAD